MDILNSKRNRNVKLQSILFPNDDICSEEALYLHREEGFVLFDGYFNLFYLEKHHKYCRIEGLTLELLVSGIKKVQIMHNRDVILEKEIVVPHPSGMDRLKGKIPTLADNRRISIRLPYEEYEKGVFWFRVELGDDSDHWSVAGHYAAELDTKADDVEIAIDICTYKREQYVVRNMRSLLEWIKEIDIDGEKHEAAEHIKVFIVDNARTLEEDQEYNNLFTGLQGKAFENLIEVIPNANTGGAGGFTRGMEEALSRKDKEGFTHVLLMDDDATFAPDLFVRIYGILSTLKHEYRELTIGGALWRQDYPFIQYSAGEWYEKLEISNEMPSVDLRTYDECTQDEMCATEYELARYSGWWCCCYSLDVVNVDNLPLKQMFIHMDDIEFEKRNRLKGNPVAFFNGIGVWHKAFDTEFLGAKTYYNTRNSLMMTAMHEKELTCSFVKRRICRMLIGNCLDNRYLKMHMIYMGVMDFLKGKEWFDHLDTEAHHKELSQYVKDSYAKVIVVDPDDKRIESVRDEIAKFQSGPIPLSTVKSIYKYRNVHLPLLKKLSLNGKLFPKKKDVALVFPHDRLWVKGYRQNKYVFVQRDPDRVYYVKSRWSETFALFVMLVNITLRFRKTSLEQWHLLF
ncbi:MAG: glycosyltransferase family 2 protein [Butyrivibrio sp.]|nr:glycosyltransferase family 2 protein [Butyrivibrio sp.]